MQQVAYTFYLKSCMYSDKYVDFLVSFNRKRVIHASKYMWTQVSIIYLNKLKSPIEQEDLWNSLFQNTVVLTVYLNILDISLPWINYIRQTVCFIILLIKNRIINSNLVDILMITLCPVLG